MNSLMCSVWAVMIPIAVVVTILPTLVFGNLGAALRAGAGTLTKFALGNHIIYCTFTNVDGKPPMLSHVRVSREPQPRTPFKSEFDSGSPQIQGGRIRSPSYQHKILQFHNNGHSSSGQDYYPTKLIVQEYPSVKSLPVYPVPSKYGKSGSRYLVKSTSTGSVGAADGESGEEDDDSSAGNDSWENLEGRWKPNLLPEPEDPTFTPYIGARALTNMPRFFDHLRENLEAMLERGREFNLGTKTGNLKESDASSGHSKDTANKELVDDTEQIATPTRRGFSSKPETNTLEQDISNQMMADRGDVTSRDSRSLSANRFHNQDGKPTYDISNSNDVEDLDEKTRELLRFLGHGEPEYPKANKHNPAWLFTNLGLGKRSRPRFRIHSLN